MRRDNLLSGNTKSCHICGKVAKGRHKIHGGYETRLYRIWCGMKGRCKNPTNKAYKDYGGRGITICDEWDKDFSAFRDWALGHGYEDWLSIDRVDNDKGYSPDNYRWATAKEQSNNRRPKRA